MTRPPLEKEAALQKHEDDPMIQRVLSMGLAVTGGYESDLEELLGPDWREKLVLTPETKSYVELLRQATPVRLVSASFIIYGALVVGGGRATQAKVRGVFGDCQHQLFDVADDMKLARKTFKTTFDQIGKDFPEDFEELTAASAEFMSQNNRVVFSVPCVGKRVVVWSVAFGVGLLGVGLAAKALARR
jgi:heme oxygenase